MTVYANAEHQNPAYAKAVHPKYIQKTAYDNAVHQIYNVYKACQKEKLYASCVSSGSTVKRPFRLSLLKPQ